MEPPQKSWAKEEAICPTLPRLPISVIGSGRTGACMGARPCACSVSHTDWHLALQDRMNHPALRGFSLSPACMAGMQAQVHLSDPQVHGDRAQPHLSARLAKMPMRLSSPSK